MKFSVKFNTRKVNKQFGDFADDVREMCCADRRINDCHPAAVELLKADGLATVSSKGPGWPLMVVVDLDAMQKAGLVLSWDIR